MHLKKIIASTCLALGLTVAAFQPAHSYYVPNQPDKSKGYYIYAGLGAATVDDSDVNVVNTGIIGAQSFDIGTMVTAGLGYRFSGNGLRAELEYAYRGNEVSESPPGLTFSGDDKNLYESKSIMANLLYEMRRKKKIRPYVGFGVGYTFLKNGGDADQQLAYQGILGTLFSMTDDIDIGLAYKYFSTFDDPEMSVKSNPAPVDIEYPYAAHSLELRGVLNF